MKETPTHFSERSKITNKIENSDIVDMLVVVAVLVVVSFGKHSAHGEEAVPCGWTGREGGGTEARWFILFALQTPLRAITTI